MNLQCLQPVLHAVPDAAGEGTLLRARSFGFHAPLTSPAVRRLSELSRRMHSLRKSLRLLPGVTPSIQNQWLASLRAHLQRSHHSMLTIPSSCQIVAAVLAAASMAFAASSSNAAAPPVTAKREGKQIILHAGDREVLRYQAEPGELPRAGIKEAFRRGGYLHPIYTPSGRPVTDDFPPNHIHHHGIWWAWTKTDFEARGPDFWNMGDQKGRVEFVAVDDIWGKGARAGFKARHRFVDLLAQPAKGALEETWEVVVSAANDGTPRHIIDLTSTQTCANEAPLKLPKYHYGGLGFRGNWAWNGAEACRFLTSEGIVDRKEGNGSRGTWCWIGGTLDGQVAGATILCDPLNFGFPQPMRLHPTEPFFCYAPQQLGDMAIEPGKPYVSRYRIIITDGEVKREQADAWWQEWTEKEVSSKESSGPDNAANGR